MRKAIVLIVPLLVIIIGNSHAQNNVSKDYDLPQVMIRLCNISYITDKTEKKRIVADSIKSQLSGWKLVWGPVELADIFGITYSSMYVAKDTTKDAYAVVIRGTDPTSLKSWLGEDFEIHKSVKFSKFVPAPAAAKISEGACNGLDDLIQLKDPEKEGTVVSFLKNELQMKKMNSLFVTGHSLGGTLTPAFYMYLCYKLFGGPVPRGEKVTTRPYSFAGLTAGNQAFNDHLKTYLQVGDEQWRYVNPFDIAPKLWDSLHAVKNIYAAKGLSFGSPESEFMDYLFERAQPNNYTQPPGSERPLPAVYNPCETIWLFQALSQHHSSTYIKLVDSLYRSNN